MGASKYLPHYNSSRGSGFGGLFIYSNRSSMVINLSGLDKYDSKHIVSRKNS